MRRQIGFMATELEAVALPEFVYFQGKTPAANSRRKSRIRINVYLIKSLVPLYNHPRAKAK